jgi:histidinol-phosphatase (PHP family)
MITNYHTHTYRCYHAKGDVIDYVREAVKQDVGILGMSDHTPLPDQRWKRVRMRLSELAGYCRAIEKARIEFPSIKILSGLECDFSDDYRAFFDEELLGNFGLQYLISGTHWFPCNGSWLDVGDELESVSHLAAYARHLVRAMESGLFAFIAHPDMFARSYRAWDENAIAASREIVMASVHSGIPLEINCYGFRKKEIKTADGSRAPYPLEKFWELAAQYPLSVVVNSDAHKPADVGDVTRGKKLAGKYQLKIVEPEIKNS